MAESLVAKTAAFVRRKIYDDPSGNDWYHLERVLTNARRLQAEEGGELELIELAVLLHELRNYKQKVFNEKKGILAMRAMMDILGIEEIRKNQIVTIVIESQYSGNETKVPSTLEGKIFQDADWLDALGAIGIARTFAAGGHISRMLHDPNKHPRKNLTKADYEYRKTEGTSLNYFYEKLLKLPKMMHTRTAQKMAKERAAFVEHFISEFLKEWEGKK